MQVKHQVVGSILPLFNGLFQKLYICNCDVKELIVVHFNIHPGMLYLDCKAEWYTWGLTISFK